MTNTETTLNEILNSELMVRLIKEEEDALSEAGWTRKDVESMANFIIKKSK